MSQPEGNLFRLIFLALGLFLGVTACVLGSQAPNTPTSVITYPHPGQNFNQGEEIVVQSVSAVAGGKMISRVELWVDDELVHIEPVEPPASSWTTSQPWVATAVDSHLLEIRAFNVDNVPGEPAQRVILVTNDQPHTTPATGEIATAGIQTPASATTPFGPTENSDELDQFDTPESNIPIVIVLIGLNVRAGPGVEYPVIGGLAEGASAQISGANHDRTWWQIVYPPGSSERAWVSAKDKYSQALHTETVPTVDAPEIPTATPAEIDVPTQTVTARPLPTPNELDVIDTVKPMIHSFTAERYAVTPNEPVTLHWSFSNADVAYLRYEGVDDLVESPGTSSVEPSYTTTYTLVARNTAGTSTAQLTIVVGQQSLESAIALDLLATAPEVAWTSAYGTNLLHWPGSEQDQQGFALWKDNPILEDGSQPDRVLLSYPEHVTNGHIVGTFDLPRPIVSGDHLKSRVGFLHGASGSVTFVIVASGGSLPGEQIVAAIDDDGVDGEIRNIEVDLGSVAGGTNVHLVVQAGSSAEGDWAVWIAPRIEHHGLDLE